MFIPKTFDDLNFQPHAHAKDMGVQASMTFDNGYSISVVANDEGGNCFYGNHPYTYEVPFSISVVILYHYNLTMMFWAGKTLCKYPS